MGPWIVKAHEYCGRRFGPMSQMRDFGDSLAACGLTNLNFTSFKFTWSNRWSWDKNVKTRQDRMVMNHEMLLAFLNMLIHHLNSIVSYHLPLLL